MPDQRLVAHEVTTVVPFGKKHIMKKYIVITRSTSNAVNNVPLEDGEEIVHANEMLGYKVIMEGEK